MAENVKPGYNGGTCYEVDIFEANNNAMQTAIHTELGGSYGSGNCDRNGCFARVGGPQSPRDLQGKYGKYKTINSMKKFLVSVKSDSDGALTITLSQDGKTVQSFNRYMAGNPQGKGVPQRALGHMKDAQGKLALVASMWSSPDLSWLDGPGCNQCSLPSASFTLKLLKGSAPGAATGAPAAMMQGLNPNYASAMAESLTTAVEEAAVDSVVEDGNSFIIPG